MLDNYYSGRHLCADFFKVFRPPSVFSGAATIFCKRVFAALAVSLVGLTRNRMYHLFGFLHMCRAFKNLTFAASGIFSF